ncbi:UNVERIFIED_CONTAM: hypothetical protein PYX00_008567 [Menopon gallinae]|uniref:Ubiquitin carboxyl-terminal hydrolase n=1 Tax=Menopon gallinae TaxID=328185 RepID=A0AAW2HP14_9NEOP
MECPHLVENVKIESVLEDKAQDIGKNKECAVCSSPINPWLCLFCGLTHCGRYVNAHAREHSNQHKQHTVCMDITNFSVYCYTCDEFVNNDVDDKQISKVRQILQSRLKSDSDPLSMGDDNAVDFNNTSISNSVIDDDQASWKSGNSDSLGKETQENVRSLRPRSRKRSHSNDSGSENTVKMNCTRPRHSREKKTPLVGLRNLGNTCFMNAVLQSLSNIQEFCLYFKQLPSLERHTNGRKVYHSTRSIKEISDELIAEELRKVLISLNQGDSKEAISPNELFSAIWKVVPRFRGYQQQDAHEFLRYMLDRLHTELLSLLPDETLRDSQYISLDHKGRSSIVTSVFGGTLQSEVRCLNCFTESKKHDPFLDLSLDIPDKYLYGQKKNKDIDEILPPCTIADCLTSFIEVEELAETELYYCNNCKSKQRSTKRFWIRRLPNVLCLHLKRFRWNSHFRTKIDTEIVFPTTALDMSQFVLSNIHETRQSGAGTNLYDLAAVIVHHGSGVGCGHYTAFAINDGEWFHFNDSTVRPTGQATVAKCKPYILFYIRREFTLPRVQNS